MKRRYFIIAILFFANILQCGAIFVLMCKKVIIADLNSADSEILPTVYLSPAQSWETCIEDMGIKADIALFGDSMMRWGG